MRESLLPSFKKFILLSLVLVTGLLLIKNSTNTDPERNLSRYINAGDNVPKILFVGSSRTRSGILVEQLLKLDSTKAYYNLGSARSSILFSYRMAEKLIKISPEKSLIYIELSDLLSTAPYQAEYFYTSDDFFEILKRHFRMRFSFADVDRLLLQFFNIRADLDHFRYDEKQALAQIEYQIEKAPFYGNASSVVTGEDLENAPTELSDFQKDYLVMLDKLVEKGSEKKITIKYFLPVTIEKATERAQTLSIYNHIPTSNKLVYSKEFLEKIHSSIFLADPNHLNSKGGYFNTLEVYRDIEATMKGVL